MRTRILAVIVAMAVASVAQAGNQTYYGHPRCMTRADILWEIQSRQASARLQMYYKINGPRKSVKELQKEISARARQGANKK